MSGVLVFSSKSVVSLRRDITPGAGISLEGVCECFALSEALKTGLKLGLTKKGIP